MEKRNNRAMTVIFKNSLEKKNVDLTTLIDSTKEFLQIYQQSDFAQTDFWEIVADENGQAQFSELLKSTGFTDDAEGFFSAVLNEVALGTGEAVVIQGVILPHALLVALLEQILPGHGYISIKSVQQLVDLTNCDIPEEQKDDIQKVIEIYPVRLSRHTIRQLMVSKAVAYQYMPFIQELNPTGFDNTWIGQFHDGLFEQMYQNRVIFLLNMACPVYCRFCFRKHKDSRNEKNPTPHDVKKAVGQVEKSKSIKEIVVTGGDPFMHRPNMEATIEGLMQVDHVQTLRLATRSIAYYPNMFLENDEEYLNYLKGKNLQLQKQGKRMEVATHFIHPDEISPESLEIISELVNNGIAVYIQTPFLNNCNDSGPELVELFSRLRGAGAEIHYIYIPCSPIKGNSIYWKPLSYGIDMGAFLRANLSDRAIPRICTATPIGKMDWFSSGWAVEKDAENENFIWIRTPYTPEFFKKFAPLANDLEIIRSNDEGTIDIKYLAEIGNDSYLIGPRPKRKTTRHQPARAEEIEQIKQKLANTRQTAHSIIDTGLEHLCRTHKTKVEISPDAGEESLNYIANNNQITDVVISATEDAIDILFSIKKIMRKLADIPHVNTVRLRSMAFTNAPERFTRGIINTLATLNNVRTISPLRLEIETWFILPNELTMAHKTMVKKLNNKGISVYCNVPLLGGINDRDTIIQELANKLRKAGIEFHHLYIAGLPIQNPRNTDFPIDSYDVTDIATMVRREGSGREIPRYIISTIYGEVDYGLTSSFIQEQDTCKIKLDCYDKAYYLAMNPYYTFAQDVEFDDEKPVVEVPGLIKTNPFPVS
ncbi:radical SAM protein [uncultured Desulfuromusa sp.]|uniref:radical SAM protein n=1 Tax=uncultured Desulfuromusa sp. TaxID=219183 RepID=UPI002AA7AD9C|nr:radical SAM protein [uncultured Desulfuromusa sp.]